MELFLGTAEQLPFREEAFDTVFHVGGINFFNDKQAAVNEMIRTAKIGTRLLIGDENEKGAKFYEGTLPGFSSSFKDGRAAVTAPVGLIPPGDGRCEGGIRVERVFLFDQFYQTVGINIY